jgi:hypothetical protein
VLRCSARFYFGPIVVQWYITELYINNIVDLIGDHGDLIETADVHFYAHDTVLYSSGSSLSLAFENAFRTVLHLIR